MNKTIIIYRSATGFTRQYALWLGEALDCGTVPYEERQKIRLEDYEQVIFGGWCHAGGIQGLSWLRKQLPRLKGKRLAVFAVGASPADSPDVEKALAANFPSPKWEGTARFYLQGGLNYERMGAVDRFLMSCFRQMVKKKEGADSETYRWLSHSYDLLDRDSLTPLIEWAKNE